MEFNRKNARDLMISNLESEDELKRFEEIQEKVFTAAKEGKSHVDITDTEISLYCQARLESVGFIVCFNHYRNRIGGAYQVRWVDFLK